MEESKMLELVFEISERIGGLLGGEVLSSIKPSSDHAQFNYKNGDIIVTVPLSQLSIVSLEDASQEIANTIADTLEVSNSTIWGKKSGNA
jgi:hypothetical protein